MKSFCFCASLLLAGTALAGREPDWPAYTEPMNLSGPRLGFTVLSQDLVDKVREEHGNELSPLVSQFGWHQEQRMFVLDNGMTGLSEWILLAGGFEQNLLIPSLSWLIGVRTGKGMELGMGPNINPMGTSLVMAYGMTFEQGGVNFPVNVALSHNKDGARLSLITGFSWRKDTSRKQPRPRLPVFD